MKKLSMLCTLVAMSALVAACGSSGDDGGGSTGSTTGSTASSSGAGDSGLTAAKAAVEKAGAPIGKWEGPTSSPPPAKGKFVVAIPCSNAAAGCKRPMDAFEEAAHAMGWKTLNIDPQGDLQKWKAAFATAIRLHADGVATIGANTTIFKQQLDALHKAGVVPINVSGAKPNGPPEWFANIYQHNYDQGVLEAAYLTAKSGGKAKILLTNDSEYDSILEWLDGFKAGLKQYCPGCQIVDEIKFTLVDFQTTLPAKVKASLRAHPDIDWIWGSYDAASVPVVQAVQQAGLTGKVQLVSVNGDPQNVDFIANDQVQTGTVANCLEWEGYAAIDQMNRAFNKEPAIADEHYGTKLITKSNVPQPTNKPWDCDLDFRSEYKKIWKVG